MPIDLILKIVSEFVFSCSQRFKEIEKISTGFKNPKITELMDLRAYQKLSDIAHSLLKLGDDYMVLRFQGLQRYFQFIWTKIE